MDDGIEVLDTVDIQSPSEPQVCHGPGNILPKGDLTIYVFYVNSYLIIITVYYH